MGSVQYILKGTISEMGNLLKEQIKYHLKKVKLICFQRHFSSVIREFAHGVMGHWIDPSKWTH